MVGIIGERIDEWLARHPIRVGCDPALSPVKWIESIMREAREHKSQGRVEQHLVGAKLETRHPGTEIPVHSATAGDVQTGRPGDFQVGRWIYHVTVAPTAALIDKCRANLEEGLRPVVLVPRALTERAKGLASGPGIEDRTSVYAIEDFVAQNLSEISADSDMAPLDVLKTIVDRYNSRVEKAEVDPALRINLK